MLKLRYSIGFLKIFKIAVSCCILTFIAPQSYAQTAKQQTTPQFFHALKDVPLMSGLSELKEETIIYDKPEGQIVEVSALISNISQDSIITFYESVLPQFGWNRTEKNVFFRRNEFLEISFSEQDAQKHLKIMVRPAL